MRGISERDGMTGRTGVGANPLGASSFELVVRDAGKWQAVVRQPSQEFLMGRCLLRFMRKSQRVLQAQLNPETLLKSGLDKDIHQKCGAYYSWVFLSDTLKSGKAPETPDSA
jgi:hypothetical protein